MTDLPVATNPDRPASPARLALRRFRRHRAAVAAAILLALLLIAVLLGPVLCRYPPDQIDLHAVNQAPGAAHWLGTDNNGRDELARLLAGGRISLLVGVVAALISVLLGTFLGALAGLAGGVVRAIIMRATDIVLAVPTIVLVVVLAGVLGPSVGILVLAIGVTHWPQACRVVHGLTLSLRERDFVAAARLGGAGTGRILRVHVLPAALPPVIVTGTLAVAAAILLEATLSFVGLGVQPPQASWGSLLTAAQSLTILESMPWLWLPPGIAIAVTVLAVNFLGDGLRDALDPGPGHR